MAANYKKMVEINNAGAAALEQAALEKIAERKKLKEKVSKLDREIRDLKAGYKALTGKSLIGVENETGKPVLDWVEEILREKDPERKGVHVDLLVETLKQRNVQSAKQTVAAGLIRFHNQSKRFIRTAKNTFALRKN
jgi:hypothetical protein